MLKWILLIPLWLLAVPSYALPLKPFSATYKTSYDLGFSIDIEAERTLKQSRNGQWILDFRAKNWFARIQQTSTFFITSTSEFKPLLYRRYQKVFGKSKEQNVIFHWDRQQVTNDIDNKPWKMDIPLDAQDLLSYQLKLRYDLMQHPKQKQFQYPVADGGRIKNFTFKLESLRHSEMDVEHLVWLAKDWDNLLVRISPVLRKDKEEPVFLVKATLAGKKVEGF